MMTTCAQADYRDISLAVNALPKIDERAFIDANMSQSAVEEG